MQAARIPKSLPGLFCLCLLVAGCGHRRVHAPAPPPPPPAQSEQPTPSFKPAPDRILSSQVGIASWYGAPYHNARAANGRIYDQNAMTAAHRTLPMGTTVRVTNLATRQSAVVTITDRGPFVRGRIIDLSRASAIKTGVYRTGTARVRVDVLRTPASASREGRWCVQIGAFRRAHSAKILRDHLQRQYSTANVIEFKGATGYWVRIRPASGSHRSAEQVAGTIQTRDAAAYLVRLN